MTERGRDVAGSPASGMLWSEIEKSIPQAILVVDPEGSIVSANPALERHSGFPASEIVGKRIDWMFDLSESGLDDSNWPIVFSGVPVQYDCAMRRIDGPSLPVLFTATAMFDVAGNVIGVACTAQDLSERIAAEVETRRSRASLLAIVNNTPSIIVSVDPGNRLSTFNEAFEQIWLELTGVPAAPGVEVVPMLPAFMKRAAIKYLNRVSRGEAFVVENRIPFPHGTAYYEISMTPIMADDGATYMGASVFASDISERRRNRDELTRARVKAERAAEVQARFLAMMSHEIRTPLNGVIGMAELLGRTPLNVEQVDYVNIVLSSSHLLRSLVDDILDFSKLEADRVDVEDRSFDVYQAVDQVIDVATSGALKKGLDLAGYIHSDVPRYVMGDSTRVRQILVNLVSNAVKFTDEGSVRVVVRRSGRGEGPLDLHLSVLDTGIGIAPHRLESLFEPFSQADVSTTRRYGGTGLGLAIVRRLATLMEGRVWAESELDVGSVFHAELRLGRSGLHQQKSEPLPKGKRVLVVEEPGATQETVHRSVEDWGLTAVSTDVIEDVLTWIQEDKFDVVVVGDRWLASQTNGLDRIVSARSTGGGPQPVGILVYPLTTKAPTAPPGFRLLPRPVKQIRLFRTLSDVFGYRHEARIQIEASSRFAHLRGLAVLLAEDNMVNQKVAIRMLEYMGLETDAVDNGRQAVEAAARTAYDLILLDVEMPEMDGIEAATEIRRLLGAKTPPIIALTAHSVEHFRKRCRESGMIDFIGKPISMDRLSDLLCGLFPAK